MKAVALLWLFLLMSLSACSGWPSEPYVNQPGTTSPSRTPRVQTATPVVFTPTPMLMTPATATATPLPDTATPTFPAPSDTPTVEATPTALAPRIDILGCDTGIDLLHGMGEVTNAYVTISNPAESDLSNVCATLRGLDEARQHPDKTRCTATLPAGYQITFKLTVDTTYKEATPIQADVTAGDLLLARVGEPACQAIGVLLPGVGELGVLIPIPEP